MYIKSALKRREDGEKGFTLVEVMVAIMIIGILAAIGIPTYLGARQRGYDRAAQATVNNALLHAETLFSDSQTFSTVNHAEMQTGQGTDYVAYTTRSTEPSEVSVWGQTRGWSAAAASQSGICYMMRHYPDGTTQYMKRTDGTTYCSAYYAWYWSTAASW